MRDVTFFCSCYFTTDNFRTFRVEFNNALFFQFINPNIKRELEKSLVVSRGFELFYTKFAPSF